MEIHQYIQEWRDKRILVIGEALTDRYIFGNVDSISPDAPVPNVKINESKIYLGALGLVLQYIQSLGGKPDVCTVLGDDYEGEFFKREVDNLGIPTKYIVVDQNISTPQVTRIKAMDQHLLRLETDYSIELSSETVKDTLERIKKLAHKYDSIILLDYGAGALFQDFFIQNLLSLLKTKFENVPIIARPNTVSYYLYEDIDLIKINLQKALNQFSIDCCTDTSVSIVGKRILNSTRCKNLFFNYLETDSYLFSYKKERMDVFKPILNEPVTSFVAVGSAIMAVLGLCYATHVPISTGIRIALHAAVLSATSPPVNFYTSKELAEFISSRI